MIKVDETWKQTNGLYQCPYCKAEKPKKGIATHIFLKHTKKGINKKSNFIDYNRKVNAGLLPRSKNQYEQAKETGIPYILSNETRKKIGNGKRNKPLSSVTKAKLSLARSRYLEETGKGGFQTIKWYRINNNNNIEFIVRGTWELKVAEWLNSKNIIWVRKIYLPYIKDGIHKTYTPDFYLPDKNLYLEVKGYFSQLDREKINLVKNQNKIELQLIFGKDLNTLEEIIK